MLQNPNIYLISIHFQIHFLMPCLWNAAKSKQKLTRNTLLNGIHFIYQDLYSACKQTFIIASISDLTTVNECSLFYAPHCTNLYLWKLFTSIFSVAFDTNLDLFIFFSVEHRENAKILTQLSSNFFASKIINGSI